MVGEGGRGEGVERREHCLAGGGAEGRGGQLERAHVAVSARRATPASARLVPPRTLRLFLQTSNRRR
eukprot:1193341-Prorocentrum_minimum.AAC.2